MQYQHQATLYNHLRQLRGLIAFWPIDEPSGTNIDDKGANNLDGTINGAVALAQTSMTGDGKTSMRIDATAEWVNVPDNALLEPQSISVITLVTLVTLAPSSSILLVRKLDGTSGTYFMRQQPGAPESGAIGWWIRTGAGPDYTKLGNYPEPEANAPTATTLLLVGTFDHATKVGRLFVNGVQSGTDVVASAGIDYTGSGALEIGRSGVAGTNHRQQMTAIIDRALTPTEVAELQAAVNDASGDLLLEETGYYQTWTFEDQLNVSSGESERFYFRHSKPPILTFTAIPNPLTDPTPLLAWSGTYFGGRTQQEYRVQIVQGADTVLDTGWVEGDPVTFQVPPATLDTALTTTITVTVRDDDGNEVSEFQTFSTSFSVPPTPLDLVLTPNIADSSVDMAWTDWNPADGGLDYWIIRRKAADGNSVEIGHAFEGDPTFRDFGAPVGVALEYELVAYNGWAESLPATASTLLETDIPGSSVIATEGFAIEFTQVTDVPSEYAPIQEVLQPIGRPNPVVEALSTGTESGTITVRVPPEERWQVNAVRNLAGAVDTKIWIKDRYGSTFRVAVGNVRRVPGPDGMIELQASWVKVGD
jgi:hypothetical protein